MFRGTHILSALLFVCLLINANIVRAETDTPKGEEPTTQPTADSDALTPLSEADKQFNNFTVAPPSDVLLTERRPLLALKSNLLFDVVSAVNIEVEVPFANQWSVAAEYIFPWWLWRQKQICFQAMSVNLEGRYWLGKRQDKKDLTGWFAGVYAGGGVYDLEWKTKGYQGEFFIAAGCSGGYAHTINKSGSLRMEYAVGVGYLQSLYREYIPINGGEILAWQKSGLFSWLGPTRAKVSLVWMIDIKSRKGAPR